jgi:hypothetical protein
VYIHPHSRYDTTNMSEETTTTAASSPSRSALDIFCQPPAPGSTTLTPATTTATQHQQPDYTFDKDDINILDFCIQEAGLEEQLTATPDGIEGLGVTRLQNDEVVRVLAVIVARCQGVTWKILESEGNSFGKINPLAQKEPKTLKKLFKTSEDVFKRVLAAKLEAKLVERTTSPKKKYVIGRVGKDEDGILRHPDTGELLEVEADNGKLLEFALEKVHPDYKRTVADTDKGAGSRPIVYNIAFIGTNPAAASVPKAAEAIEATFSEVSGGNQAENSPFG